ncbi:conserved protein of unknown function [Ectopseudomonas oleovorans]|uniref:Uncharacterized protein n=1 Tax=Ectopseudomonas oleovorans TaxID=301 RepID=A0A653AYD0_ECTOL|nr:conserved protein of unknown function [Pseudomonas oleovorans]
MPAMLLRSARRQAGSYRFSVRHLHFVQSRPQGGSRFTDPPPRKAIRSRSIALVDEKSVIHPTVGWITLHRSTATQGHPQPIHRPGG